MKTDNKKSILAVLALGAVLATAATPIVGADAGWYMTRQAGLGEGAEWGVSGAGGFLGGYGGFWAGGRLGAMVGVSGGPIGAVIGGTIGAGVGSL